MQLFVLQSNIERFAGLLAGDLTPSSRAVVEGLMHAARRDLALLEADRTGAYGMAGGSGATGEASQADRLKAFESLATPTLLLCPKPGLHIVDVNAAYALATQVGRDQAAGERLFDLFPDNPDVPDADGVNNLYASLRRVAQTGLPDRMALQRYDVRVRGVFVERYWRAVNTPVFDEQGRLKHIAHQVQDVTAEIRP